MIGCTLTKYGNVQWEEKWLVCGYESNITWGAVWIDTLLASRPCDMMEGTSRILHGSSMRLSMFGCGSHLCFLSAVLFFNVQTANVSLIFPQNEMDRQEVLRVCTSPENIVLRQWTQRERVYQLVSPMTYAASSNRFWGSKIARPLWRILEICEGNFRIAVNLCKMHLGPCLRMEVEMSTPTRALSALLPRRVHIESSSTHISYNIY